MSAKRCGGNRVAAALAGLALAAAACSVNPATGERQLALIGQGQEIELGRQADREIAAAMGLYPDERVQGYVAQLGRGLAQRAERPDLPWTFRVLDDPVVNAFALPGGFIYVTRGLMTHLDSEAQLAAVLGHEIGHVTARHSVERLSKQQLAGLGLAVGMVLEPELRNYGDLAQVGLGLLFLKYSRDDERQADQLGLRYIDAAAYDPRQMVEVFDVLRRVGARQGDGGRVPGWLATHPTPENRIAEVSAVVAKLPGDLTQRTVARARYLESLDGFVFGENPREGYFSGDTFIHPELAFQLRFPAGWKTSNQRQAVGAISPREDAVVVLTLSGRSSPEEAAREFFSQQGVEQGPVLAASLGGGRAVAHVFEVTRQQRPSLQGLAAFAELGGKVYQLLGYTLQSRWPSYDSTLSQSIATFGPVTDRRLLAVQPQRIEVVRLPAAMTLEEFARRYPSTVDLETLAIINQVEPGERLAAGREVKRVVGGELPGRRR